MGPFTTILVVGKNHGGVEPRESVAFAGLLPSGGELARPQRPRRHASELLPVIREVPLIPEFAITDATDADLHLLADDLGHLCGEIGVCGCHPRQPPRMRSSDATFTSLHVFPFPST
jgi:hypothetical protein